MPLAVVEREPPVPPPAISSSLSPCSRRIWSNGMPSRLDQHLRERRRVALAVVERAGDDGDGAVGLEADAAHLLVGRRGDFEIVADAAMPRSLPRFLLSRLALGKAFQSASFRAWSSTRREFAAVVGHADGAL